MLKKIVFILCLASCGTVFGRWANFSDAPVEVIQRDAQILVHADGSCEFDVVKQIKILNERGREANGKLSLFYNYDNSKLTVIEAKTIYDGKEYKLDQNLIEDKPLASEIQGFDQTHQVLLAYPNVNVGATLYVHYKLNVVDAEVPGFFEYMFDFVDYYTKEATFKIKSALPLFVNINDPENYLNVVQSKDDKFHNLDIKLLKPIYISIVDEKSAQVNPKKYPWVFVASTDKWDTFAQMYTKDYLKIVQEPLPKMYQNIVDSLAEVNDPIEQISLVAAQLNENIQYMGDWKTSNGRHVPQHLQDVANKRLGDCKDFASGMVAILQRLGIKANVALVQRGSGIYDTNLIKLPGGFHFNHAMVRVELADKKVLWVDPTNFFSLATKILPDIADRQALVLDSTSFLAQIPQSNPADNVVITKETFDLKNTDIIKVHTELQLNGLSAVNITGAGLQVSQDTIDNAIIAELGNFENIIDKKVIAPKLDTRLVKDLTFKVDYTERNMLLNTNAGRAFLLKNKFTERFLFNGEQVADIYMGAPKTIQTSVTLNNIQISNTDVLDYTLHSPWVDVIRTVKYKQNSVTVDQKVIIKISWLTNETIRSKEYQSFADELARNCKDGIAIVFN